MRPQGSDARRQGPRLACVVAAVAEAVLAVAGSVTAEEPRVIAQHTVPSIPLSAGVMMGGLSDLAVVRDKAGALVAWTLTDRGPNGMAGEGKNSRRTLLAPHFVPTLVRLRLPATGEVTVETVLPLTGAGGTLFSGRPNGAGRDEPILDAAGEAALAADPNGVDPEGLVVMPDGSFWVCEEYRPSLLRVSAEGRVLERHVPKGVTLPGADTNVVADIPAAYGDRRDNRGFEGLALSVDGKRLFVMLQSPLDHPERKAAKKTGNVRLLVASATTGAAVAEHVYRLGDPADPDYATTGVPPDDGKLCCLATLADGTLLVLEQDDTGLARLYQADLTSASDTLPRTLAAQESAGSVEPLETIRDLAAAGISPLAKRLVADLGPLVPQLRRDAFGNAGSGGEARLKLEGLAVLDDRRIMLVNDNDFGVPDPRSPPPRSCLWVIELPTPLPAHGSLTAGR
jgi:hypothetical protein